MTDTLIYRGRVFYMLLLLLMMMMMMAVLLHCADCDLGDNPDDQLVPPLIADQLRNLNFIFLSESLTYLYFNLVWSSYR